MKSSQLIKLFSSFHILLSGLTILALSILVLMGVYNCATPFMQSHMDMGKHAMVNCNSEKNCGMDVGVHLSVWQSMFTTHLDSSVLSLILSLIIVFFTVNTGKILSLHNPSTPNTRYLFYEQQHPENRLYNYFLHLFASGILEPKIFA